MAEPRSGVLWRVQLAALVLLSVFGAIVSFRAFAGFVMEDSYITLRYAQNLAEGHGFVFTPGERVLGTTTPLYAVLLALCGLVGIDLELASSLLFSICTGALALCGGLLLRRLGTGSGALVFAVLTIYGLDGLYSLWGMELALIVTLVLGSTLLAVDRRYIAASVLAALAFLTRYDAAVFAISLYLVIYLREREVPWKPGFVALAIVTPWLAFSQFYFGSIFPNTLGAKAGVLPFAEYFTGSMKVMAEHTWHPLRFLDPALHEEPRIQLALNAVVGFGLLAAVYRLIRRDPMPAVLLLMSAGLLIGYSLIGPPLVFFWYRTPVVYSSVLLALFGWGSLFERFKYRRALGWFVLIPVVFAAALLPASKDREAHQYTNNLQYDGRILAYGEIADWIVRSRLDEQTLLTHEPGYLAYRTQNPVIDAAGLVSKGIYFHGDRSRKTGIVQLVDRFEPELMILGAPFSHPSYIPAYATLPSARMLVRSDVFDENFENLVSSFLEPPPAHEIESSIKHPFHFDVKIVSIRRWERAGGTLIAAGRQTPLTVDGQPYQEQRLFLKQVTPGLALGSETPQFYIDFDRLRFRFAATESQTTVVQLVVKGQVVFSLGGNADENGAEFSYLSLPTRPWKGQFGRLRFLVTSRDADSWLAADHIRSHVDERQEMFDDFEPRGVRPSEERFGARWDRSFEGPPPEDSSPGSRPRTELPRLGAVRIEPRPDRNSGAHQSSLHGELQPPGDVDV